MADFFLNAALWGDGWILWVLALACLLSIGLIMERAWAFHKAGGNDAGLRQHLAKALDKNDLAEALKAAKQSSGLEGRLAQSAVENLAKGPASLEELMQAQMLDEKRGLQSRLGILAGVGNQAPFLGLLGTVLGVVKAFHDLGANNTAGLSGVISSIGTALLATAVGILVAIPAGLASHYFHGRIRAALEGGEGVTRLMLAYLKADRRR